MHMLDMHPPGGFARLTLYVYDMIAASRNTHSPATTLSQFTPITEHYHTCGELEDNLGSLDIGSLGIDSLAASDTWPW
jgi:hypothetical protein